MNLQGKSTENINIPTTRNSHFGLYMYITAACLAIFAPVLIISAYSPINIPARFFLPIHLTLELSSIVVSFAVFITGWYGYKKNGNLRDLIIGITFLTTGIIDLIHALTYENMPKFLGDDDPGKAAAYWLAARLIVGIGLLSTAIIHPKTKVKKWMPRLLIAGSIAIVIAIAALLTAYEPASGKIFFDRNAGGLTTLKIALEYVVVLFYLATFLVLGRKIDWDYENIELLRSALIVAIFAELAFMFYSSPYGMINALGHTFKIFSYYLIFKALFVSAVEKPYSELSAAKEELQKLYLDAREHRIEIEKSLARIGSALSSSLMLNEALDQIAELAVDMLHADCSIVAFIEKEKDEVKVAAQKGGCHEVYRPVELTLDVGKDAIKNKKTIVINNIEETGKVKCTYTYEDCLRAMICAPMIYEDESLGIIAIYSHTANAFEAGDIKLLEGFASHAAVAIHNALSYERESKIANVLQQSILDAQSIETERFEIAQVYKPATEEALIGGDFYDIIELGNNKIGVAIGDVSGKGLAAAVHTAMAKYMLRAYAMEGHTPSKTLQLMNNAISNSIEDDAFITMFFGILDTNTGDLIYANAGHEPAIYTCGGSYQLLESTGPALGLGIDDAYCEGHVVLKKDCILFLYTDGISEARRAGLLLGSERIGEEVLICEHTNPDDVATCVHKKAIEFAGGNLRDDAAILAIRAKA